MMRALVRPMSSEPFEISNEMTNLKNLDSEECCESAAFEALENESAENGSLEEGVSMKRDLNTRAWSHSNIR